jgi:flagellar P-ring protein precursor FlgI
VKSLDAVEVDKVEKVSIFIVLLLFYIIASANLFAQKIGDISSVVGVRDNQLIGYGLVVGLKKTGDSSSKFTNQTLSNLLKNVNVKLDSKDIKSKNVAAVIVTATLPPFARQGDKLDVTISSIGDAKSLEGGTLLLTPMKAIDGKIYALAQGHLTIGGFNTGQNRGVQVHHTTVGKILNGANVEREIIYDLYNMPMATLSLKDSDFDTAVRTQNIINKYFKIKVASAVDPRTIKLQKPKNLSMIEFLAKVQNLDIETKKANNIVIDERTGTIVAGSDILVNPIVITHADMVIKIKKDTKIIELTDMFMKFNAKPKDVIAILEALKSSGALKAEILLN